MPKVELSQYQGGILATPNLNKKYLELNYKIRKKRELTNIDLNTANIGTHRKNRVVKKLVRVQLVSNNENNNNLKANTEDYKVETTTKRRRRRLKIKKKKRKLSIDESSKNLSLFEEDHLQQATRPRKRIIITRKRLLHSDNHSKDFVNSDTNIPIHSTRINAYHNSIDHTRYNTITHDYEDTSQENEINDELDEIDEEDFTESNNLEDDASQEFVTLKESDFFLNYDNSEEASFDKPKIEEDVTEYNALTETTPEVVTLKEGDFFLNNLDEDSPIMTESYSEITTPFNNVTIKMNLDTTTEQYVNVTYETTITTENPVDVTTEMITIKEDDETSARPIFQEIPEYEPYFPELTESLDAPIILLKTTVISSIEQLTKTVVQSRLRTYTFVVTRVAGTEQIVTSTTEVKPHTKTTVITEPVTRLTTLTLLDIDATKSLTNPKSSITPALDKPHSEDNQVRNYDEARNLATRVMSNGVEVIVAGDKTIPGEKDFKRLLTSGAHKPVTLKPSTLTDHMVMLIPQESSNIENLSASLYPNQFITKTCLTTFTYLTTFLESGTTTVSSHEQVVSNIATEERNTGKILPTPAVGVILTQHPNLSVGVFHTTYTYMNTILDGDQPLVVSSKHTVTNTITAPDDYLSLLKSSGTLSPVKDTNTYYSTIGLEKTLYEGNKTAVTSTKEVVTQVVITESVPPRATSVMTSYIALDVNDNPDASFITTDIVKTYFVTYTYYNTITKNNQEVVNSNISVSSDVITEKLYIIPKTSMKMDIQSKEHRLENNFQIFTTKSYLTTFTYFTTLLQDNNKETPTIVNSRTSVIENLVSETVDLSLLDKSNLNQIRNAIGKGAKSVIKTITLYNGETFDITAVANEMKETITPTKVLPIVKTQMPESIINDEKVPIDSSVPNVITGSTIVFIDDDPFAQLTATPILNKKSTDIKNNINSLSVTDKSTKLSKPKRSTKSKTKTRASSINPSKTKKPSVETAKAKPQSSSEKNKSSNNEKTKDKKNSQDEKVATKPSAQATDLLGLGSINIQAIAPVLNAMAGLISTNLKANRRSDVNITSTSNKPVENVNPPEDIQSRSPIYIPVRGLDDEFEIAESQNIASFDWVDPPPNKVITEMNSHESSIISNGIPISPGDIINTNSNSDVIVGKPGRVGPRIPSIPLHQVSQENEIPVGMKPPPVPSDWRKKNYEYKRIPVNNNFDKSQFTQNDKHQFNQNGNSQFIQNDKPNYTPNDKPQYIQNDYIGPPPQAPNEGLNINENINEIGSNAPIYAKNQKNYIPNRIQYHQNNQNYFNYKENSQTAFTHNHPVYAHNYNHNSDNSKLTHEILTAAKPNRNNIQASFIHNEPLVLPEVIERSTGQPLLVNIQPSQVAFVNIPFNRTTALIYGGSTEPHRNGQYFDDPSPYPQPEFSEVKINNGVPQITAAYHPESMNQKQVNGVIKVENQLINNEPSTSENQKVQVNIQPTKIENTNGQINVNRPPVSYEMIHHGSDFNAHVINHDDNLIRPGSNFDFFPQNDVQRRPASDINVINGNNGQYRKDFNMTHRKPTHIYHLGPVHHDQNLISNKRIPDSFRLNNQNIKPHNYQKYPNNKNNNYRTNVYASPKPNIEISEFMSPPSTPRIHTKRPYNQKQSKRPIPIPVPPQVHPGTQLQDHPQTPVNFRPSYPIYEVHVPAIPGNNPNGNSYQNIQTHFTVDSEVGNHKEDDMENDDGEVVQESNSRPLRPGEVPPEIMHASSTTERTIEHIRVSNPTLPDFTRPMYSGNNDFKFSTKPHQQIITNKNQDEQFSTTKTNNQKFNEIINEKITFENNDNIESYNQHSDRIGGQTNYVLDKPNLFGVGTHEVVSINANPGTTHRPILIFFDEKEEPKDTFFNKNKEFYNRERPAVTSLPINSFKESNNKELENKYHEFKHRERSTSTPVTIDHFKESNNNRPAVTSLPINTFKEYVIREKPATSLPIDTFKYNRPRPSTSQPLSTFKEYNNNRDRPAVTSLPINKFKEFNNRDRPAVTSVAINKDVLSNNAHKFGTQTEKPFSGIPSKTLSSNEIIRKDVASPKPLPTKIEYTDPPLDIGKINDLNTGEVPVTYNNGSKILSDMEIMKPPPLLTEIPANVPDTSMQPPSQKPNVYTVIPVKVEDSLSTLPNLSEEMVPPPKTEEKVIGMNPPPWSSPKVPPKLTTPRYSLEVDVSTDRSTLRPNDVPRKRTRRPYTRRPASRSTTTQIPVTTSRRRRPVYPEYTASATAESTSSTTPKHIIINPSPSIKVKPSLEVIIGRPDVELVNNSSSTTVKSSSSEVPISTQKSIDKSDQFGIPNKPKIELSSSIDTVVPGIHHGGNEIKVVPEITKPLPNTLKTIYNETKSKIQIPTRYITHTKTATVTITKTTVIKSLGMTPSTLTILVTKTEKTTIIDTVTEVHTLVKPTSIVETITTTIKQASSLYPDEVYGTQYPPLQIKPSIIAPFYNFNDTFVDSSENDEDLNEFIIHDTDPPIIENKEKSNNKDPLEENDTILVIMTDKNTKNIVKVPPTTYETQERDEMISTNKDNNVLLGGILIANDPKEKEVLDRCEPECKASRNELCQKLDGILRCTCRPGFARMFPDRPCLPTYTYDLELTLERIGKDPLHFYDDLRNPNTTEHFKFTQATGEALDRMVMQSDLRDIVHGVKVHNFEPGTKGIVSKFYLQLSENMEEKRLEDILKSYLLNNSFSLGGTDIYSSPLMDLKVQDFDECLQPHLHDCSENAYCFNLKGTYSCSCKEGFSDLSENMLYPGRICSAEQVGCEKCNYHGTCYSRGADEVICECFQWYTGQYCHINLKVLLIALVTLGTLLFGLLLTCIILTCIKGKPSVGVAGGINFLPQGNAGRRNTSDRRAMIQDTSSEEDNKSETSRYIKKIKPASKKTSKVSMQAPERGEATNHAISFEDQKDRSLTVMIPRAKYHPAPPTSPLMNYTSFDVRKPSVPAISNEAKLLSFLDAGPSPNKSEATRKYSNAQSESIIEEKANSRKTSGALISAGFEVSATVVNNMGTLVTTCGTEADRSENATLIQKISADLLSSTGTRSQFNTLRKSLADDDLESNVNENASHWLDMLPRVMTVSEARSYDETTIPPPMKCLRPDYDSKHSSQHHNDEANTMAERDLGSTFLLPHTHLYKPDRGSDISGFESL